MMTLEASAIESEAHETESPAPLVQSRLDLCSDDLPIHNAEARRTAMPPAVAATQKPVLAFLSKKPVWLHSSIQRLLIGALYVYVYLSTSIYIYICNCIYVYTHFGTTEVVTSARS